LDGTCDTVSRLSDAVAENICAVSGEEELFKRRDLLQDNSNNNNNSIITINDQAGGLLRLAALARSSSRLIFRAVYLLHEKGAGATIEKRLLS